MAIMSTLSLAEKLEKIKSPGLQSQQRTVVVLQAVESTLKEQNTEPTPTGYFAALLALLQNANSSGAVNTELATPVVYLLDVVTPHAPEALLRSKFTQILTLLAPVLLLRDAAEPLLLRASMGCLEALLLAQDTAAWELSVAQIGPRRAVAGLLNLALEARPKVRRRAQDALKRVLRNPPPSPAIDHPAADMCAQTALKNLEELAAQALAARKGKKAAAAAAAHDPELIHALQLVKTVAAASGGWPSTKIESLCELLLNIAKTGNEYMTMAAFEIFELIFEGMSEEVSSAKLPRLMEIISELRPAANDTQLVPPWLAILSRGYDVSAQIEPEETFQKLPDLFRMVAQFLESQSENIRISASECLISFMANCIPQQVIIDPSIYDEKTLEKLAKTAESLLTVQFQAAWLQTFNVLAAMFLSLRWRASPILLSVTRTIGEIRENSSFRNKKEADEVIGQAVRAMGPEAVLSVLPLNLIKPVKGQAGRAWMLPILRDYTSNTNLAYFRREMVPLSEVMFQRVLEHGEAPKTMEIKIYETLVQQIWSILPGYCDLPLDLTEAFDQTFAEMIANLLYKQTELRLDVCRALKTIVESNQALSTITEEEDDFLLQARVSKDTAASNLAYLGQYAGNMLAVLFNVYTQTLPQSRGPILQTVNAFLSITPKQELMDTFDRVSKMLASELENLPVAAGNKEKGNKGGKDHMPSTAQTLMDLVITMSAYLPRESFATLFEIATLIIGRDDEPQLQKKAYKLIPRLATSELGQAALQERSSELQQLIVSSSAKVSAPARRDRLAAISALLPYVSDTALHFIPSVLSEVVICCKENNERAREAAYELLVQMGTRMAAANNAPIDNRLVPHMPEDAPAGVANIEEFFTMVSAGLAGSTPHMISASVTAISRLLYEFRAALGEQTLSDLVQTMDLFLTSNNREIVKSCLGFVKVCVVSLPVELMRPRLATLVPNLIVWSSEHKGHFKAKVKHILERMVRRFGYDDVHRNCPEESRKLIVNIRKSKDRAKRKKDAAWAGGDDSGEEEEDDDEAGGKQQFDTEYDRAIYSSESEGDDDDDGGDDDEAPRQKKKSQKGGKTYILEDDDEPLDLLDKKALANISSTKPSRTRQPQKGRSRAKVDLDGKLILGKDDAAGAAADGDTAMDIDQPEGGSGVGAYVAAIKGKDAARRGRGGKLKFSNRRSRDDMADDDDDGEQLDEKSAVIIKNRISPGKAGGDRGRGGGGFRGGRGRGGGGGGRGGGRSGRGGIANGRRGLGVDKKRGGAGPTGANGVGKGRRGGGRS